MSGLPARAGKIMREAAILIRGTVYENNSKKDQGNNGAV